MKIRLSELRTVIIETLAETYRKTGVKDTRLPWEREPDAYDEPTKRMGSVEKGMASVAQGTEDEIEEMRASPEFADLDTYVSYKLDNDETAVNWMELQALARNFAAMRTGHPDAMAGKADINAMKAELDGYGFTFTPREVSRSVRGATSNSHGTHPFANSGGGGSGFSSDRGGGGGFTSFGGGPGAIGGGVPWDKSSSRNLPMGSARRR